MLRRGTCVPTAPGMIRLVLAAVTALFAATTPSAFGQSVGARTQSELSPAQRADVTAGIDGLKSTDLDRIVEGRKLIVRVADAIGRIPQKERGPLVRQLSELTVPTLSQLTRGTPAQSINAAATAIRLGSFEGARLVAVMLDSRTEGRSAIRLTAATLLEANTPSLGLSALDTAELATLVADGASREVDPLTLADELATLAGFIDATDTKSRSNPDVLKSISVAFTGCAGILERESQPPALAGGALAGVRSLRLRLATHPSREVMEVCGLALNPSLEALAKAASAAGARATAANDSSAAQSCRELRDLCDSMRTTIFRPDAGGKADRGGRNN